MENFSVSINTEKSATSRRSSRVSSASQQVQAPLLENDEIASRASQEYGGVASDSSGLSEEAAANVTQQSTIPSSRSPLCPSPVEAVFLSVVAIAILLIFSVPLFLHYLSPLSTGDTNVTNCTNVSSWVFLPANCTPSLYNSTGVCASHLMDWQSCAIGGDSGPLHINHTSSIPEQEMTASNLLTTATNTSLECRTVVAPYICQYLFPLCNNEHSLLLPSQETCMSINETCSEEDDIGGITELLSHCDSLPSQEELEGDCADGFFLSNGSCQASCHLWNQFNAGYAVALKAVQLFSAIVGVLAAIALFVTSACRYKTIFKYPAVYIVFMTIALFVPGVIGIIGQLDPGNLYCSDKKVTQSIEVPAPFCVVSGAVFQYCAVSAVLWWFFHICSVLYKLVCPVMSKKRRKIDSVIHIILTIIGCLAPVPGVIFSVIQKEYWYQIQYFPPGGLCLSRKSSYIFDSIFLVYVIASGIGISMLSIIMWILYKYQRILKAGSKWRFTLPEIKLIVVFSVYASIGFILLIYAGIFTDKSLNENNTSLYQEYFACEANGFVPGKCSEKFDDINRDHHTFFYPILFLTLSGLPLVNLVYVINWNYIKNKLQQCKKRTEEETPTAYKPVVV